MQYTTLADAFKIAKKEEKPLIFEYIVMNKCERCGNYYNSVDYEYSIIGDESVFDRFEKDYGWRIEDDEEVDIIVCDYCIIARYKFYNPDAEKYPSGYCELCQKWESGWKDAERSYYPLFLKK